MDAEEQYAYEKIDVAVETLATGIGGIRERLYGAYLVFHTLQVSHFEDEKVKKLFDRIMAGLTIVDIAPPDQGTIQAALTKMSDADCVEIADDIWSLYDVLREKHGEWANGGDEGEDIE
jgi:hypothetical protein